jgi:hypothetical protein
MLCCPAGIGIISGRVSLVLQMPAVISSSPLMVSCLLARKLFVLFVFFFHLKGRDKAEAEIALEKSF